MSGLSPLQLIFVTLTDNKGKPIGNHVAFYDMFGGIPEVVPPASGGQPELVISPINAYLAHLNEIVTLWITPDEKEKIGQAIRAMFDKHDSMTQIFGGNLVENESTPLTDTGFCVEALRAGISLLPGVPANFITYQKLYTILRMMGGM